MTFWEHLEELRSRLLKAGVAFLVGGGVAWFYRVEILSWLVTPLVLGGSKTLHISSPADAFIAYLKLSLLAGFILALPIIFYQIWAFVAPGLYAKERRFAIPFVASSTFLFCAGGYFGWKFAFPVAFEYLLGFVEGDETFAIQDVIMVDEYLQMVTRMLIAFGVVFELPVLAFFLSVAGLINHTHLLKFFRYFVVIAFVLAAILTPPDILSQFLLAVPLVLLYVVSIGIAWLVTRQRQKAKEKEDQQSKEDKK